MRQALLFTSIVVGAAVCAGCQPDERVVRDDWATFADSARAGGAGVTMGGQGSGSGAASGQRAPSSRAGYTVFLAGHEGDDRMRAAFEDATWLRGELGVPDVWFSDADGMAGVYAGRFRTAEDPDAQRILREVRGVTRGDDKPYANAKILQIQGASNDVAASPLDLRGYGGRFGYTLQIGFFDAAYPEDRRKAAEQWARQIRAEHEGVESFYYHGPHRSMVTVGLFTRRDFVRKGYTDAYGPRILALQEQFPHNLGNGMTLIERGPDGKSKGEQPSSLVRIPR